MEFSEIAKEVIADCAESYEYDGLGTIDYHNVVSDLRDYALEEWDVAISVALEDVIETELRRLGHVPND